MESGGQTQTGRKITVSRLGTLDTQNEWENRLGLLREKYPGWSFAPAQSR
jgi:hypothetical protein